MHCSSVVAAFETVKGAMDMEDRCKHHLLNRESTLMLASSQKGGFWEQFCAVQGRQGDCQLATGQLLYRTIALE